MVPLLTNGALQMPDEIETNFRILRLKQGKRLINPTFLRHDELGYASHIT